MKTNREPDESHTWIILVTLILTGFFYHWNVLYSVITTPSCNTFHIYWYANSGGGSLFQLSALIFILIGAWSLIELLLACFNKISDRLFAIITNIFIIASIIFSLYGLHKLDLLLQIYPLIYEKNINDEHTRGPLIYDLENYCVTNNNYGDQ